MKKFFYLSTCNTCVRIMDELNLKGIETQNVKEKHISKEELEFLRTTVDSYDDLLNKRARKYKAEGLKEKNLSEDELKEVILSEYTLLKRPILILENEVFLGNAKKTVEAMKEVLG